MISAGRRRRAVCRAKPRPRTSATLCRNSARGSLVVNPLAADLDHVLAHTTGLWDALRGQRWFLTGGTGFFGCWLLESFLHANERLDLNARVTVLTRDPEAFVRKAPPLAVHPAVELHPGDVRSFVFPSCPFA